MNQRFDESMKKLNLTIYIQFSNIHFQIFKEKFNLEKVKKIFGAILFYFNENFFILQAIVF